MNFQNRKKSSIDFYQMSNVISLVNHHEVYVANNQIENVKLVVYGRNIAGVARDIENQVKHHAYSAWPIDGKTIIAVTFLKLSNKKC